VADCCAARDFHETRSIGDIWTSGNRKPVCHQEINLMRNSENCDMINYEKKSPQPDKPLFA
jgi:hypothetical protein